MNRFPVLASALLCLSVTGAFTGCSSGPVPATEFVAQAERLHAEALASTATVDADLTEYLNNVGRRVVAGASDASGGKFKDPVFANMQFHLVGCDVPNAYTTGGRHVYLYNGLFQLCQSEEDLAAVLAHEFAHAIGLDVQRSGMKPVAGDTLDRLAYAYAAFPFSPSFETEADARAFDFYARGGWDPAKYGEIFERLHQAGLDRPTGASRGATNAPGIPLSARAASAASARQGSAGSRNWLKATVADAQTFKELRNRAATAAAGERATPNNRAWLYLRAFPNCVLPADLPAQQAAQQQLKKDTTPVAPTTPLEAS